LDKILKEDYSRTIPARFDLIWFSGFREDFRPMIFCQSACFAFYRQKQKYALFRKTYNTCHTTH